MMDLALFRLRLFTSSNIAIFFNSLARGAFTFVMVFYLQGPTMLLNPLDSGIFLIPVSLALAIVAPITGWFYDKYRSQIISQLGLIVSATGFILLAAMSSSISFTYLFTGLSTALGGNAWFLLMGDGPRDVILEHNTIDSDGNTVLNVYGGTSADPREVYGFQMIANAARHGAYRHQRSVLRVRQRDPDRVPARRGVHGELSRGRIAVEISGGQSLRRIVHGSVRKSPVRLHGSGGQPAQSRVAGPPGRRRRLYGARDSRRERDPRRRSPHQSTVGSWRPLHRRAIGGRAGPRRKPEPECRLQRRRQDVTC